MEKVKYFLKLFLYLIVPVSGLFLVPFLTIIFLLLYCVRYFVYLSAKIHRPDLVKFVDTNSVLIALDDMSNRPVSTLFAVGLMRGSVTLERYRKIVSNYIENGRTCKNEKVHLPELKQYYENYLGFLFWKQDINFSIENHVNLYEHDYEQVDEKILLEITKVLEKKPYVEKRSPWEILLVKNCNFRLKNKKPNEEEWTIIYRIHHGLADGYSLIKKFALSSDNPLEELQMPQSGNMNRFATILNYTLAFLWAPFELFSQLITVYDKNVWHLTENEITRDWHLVRSKELPVDMIKRIKNHHKVAFNDVLMASVSGGIRNFFLEKNPDLLPTKVHAVIGQPWPDHPWRMCNHWTYGFLELPIGIPDELDRLHKCSRNLNDLKRSLAPIIHFFLLRFFGSLPNVLITKICRNFLATMVISSMPAPKIKHTFCSGDLVMEDVFFWSGLTRGNLGIGIAILSYCQSVHFILTVDKAIIATEDDVTDLANKIYEQAVQYYSNLRPYGEAYLNGHCT